MGLKLKHFFPRVSWSHQETSSYLIQCCSRSMMSYSHNMLCVMIYCSILSTHDDVIKWKLFRITGLLCMEFPAQRPVTRSFDVFFDLRLNKWLSKQSWGWWFETLSCPLWCHSNAFLSFMQDYPSAISVILTVLSNLSKVGTWWITTNHRLSLIARFPWILLSGTVCDLWGPPGSWRPQVGPMLATRTLLSGVCIHPG